MARQIKTPVEYLENLRKKKMPLLTSKDLAAEDIATWQRKLRRKLCSLLDVSLKPDTGIKGRLVASEAKKSHWRQKWDITTSQGITIPIYLLVPRDATLPRPVIIALHGHGNGKTDVVGLTPAGREYKKRPPYIEIFNQDYTASLVDAGYIVAVPDALGFGERQGKTFPLPAGEKGVDYCRLAAMPLLVFGKPILGLRTDDTIRVVDFLSTHPLVDREKIGMIGLSLGGQMTLFTAALDIRIKMAIVSGYLCDFEGMLIDTAHCVCNHVPNLLKYAEASDIAGLIAPRAVLYESGTMDMAFPIKDVKATYKKARQIYKTLGRTERIRHLVFEGPHRYNGDLTPQWCRKWLKIS